MKKLDQDLTQKQINNFSRVTTGSAIGAVSGTGVGIVASALVGNAILGPIGGLLGAAVGAGLAYKHSSGKNGNGNGTITYS